MSYFGFEDLEVWQKAVDYSQKVILLVEGVTTDRKHYRLMEQLEQLKSAGDEIGKMLSSLIAAIKKTL